MITGYRSKNSKFVAILCIFCIVPSEGICSVHASKSTWNQIKPYLLSRHSLGGKTAATAHTHTHTPLHTHTHPHTRACNDCKCKVTQMIYFEKLMNFR
jgi:hypothetical protein